MSSIYLRHIFKNPNWKEKKMINYYNQSNCIYFNNNNTLKIVLKLTK